MRFLFCSCFLFVFLFPSFSRATVYPSGGTLVGTNMVCSAYVTANGGLAAVYPALSHPYAVTGTVSCSGGMYLDVYNAASNPCPSGYSLSLDGTVCNAPALSCPSGFTVSSDGTQCVQSSTGIAMSASDAVCTASENSVVSSGYYDQGTSPLNAMPAACSVPSGSSSGCMAIYSGSVSNQVMVGGHIHYFWHGSLSTVGGVGSSCAAGSGAPSPASSSTSLPNPSCAAGQTSGTINGQTVCVDGSGTPASSPAAVDTTSSTTTTIVNNANNTYTTTTTNNTTGQSTVVVSPGQSSNPGTQTSTTTTPQTATQAFCAQNPSAPICAGLNLGDPPAPDAIPTSSPSFSFSAVPFTSTASCPAPFSIPISVPGYSTTLTVDTTPLCNFCTTIRPIFIGLASIGAAIIFMGTFKL